jgi:hypothetical protein
MRALVLFLTVVSETSAQHVRLPMADVPSHKQLPVDPVYVTPSGPT